MNSRHLVLLALIVMLGGCRSTTYSGGIRVPEKDLEREKLAAKNRQLVLESIEIDQDARRDGARLMFNSPSPGERFGLERRAQGLLSVNSRNRCVVRVKVAEPIPTGSGRVSESVYTLVDFSGVLNEDATVATRSAPAVTGAPSRIEIQWMDDDAAMVTVWTDGTRTAYRYRFGAGRSARNVAFPH